jgi:hypothetical protein
MPSLSVQPKQSVFELTLLNAELSNISFDELIITAIKRGIPPELVTRLSDLWDKTKEIAGEVVAIGKIIVQKIIDFLIANPKLTIGIAIGAALGVLISGIPFIGPWLAPIAGAVSALYGAGVGASMQNGDYSMSPYSAGIELASKFFELLISMFNSIIDHWKIDIP